MRDVLQAIDWKSAVHVYVRLVVGDYWLHQDICDPTEPVEDIIASKVASLRQFAEFKDERSEKEPLLPVSSRLTGLAEEIIRYHAGMRPFSAADIVVSW